MEEIYVSFWKLDMRCKLTKKELTLNRKGHKERIKIKACDNFQWQKGEFIENHRASLNNFDTKNISKNRYITWACGDQNSLKSVNFSI